MRTYQIIVITPTGHHWEWTGIYPDGFAACMAGIEDYPEALRISARRLP